MGGRVSRHFRRRPRLKVEGRIAEGVGHGLVQGGRIDIGDGTQFRMGCIPKDFLDIPYGISLALELFDGEKLKKMSTSIDSPPAVESERRGQEAGSGVEPQGAFVGQFAHPRRQPGELERGEDALEGREEVSESELNISGSCGSFQHLGPNITLSYNSVKCRPRKNP